MGFDVLKGVTLIAHEPMQEKQVKRLKGKLCFDKANNQ